MRGKKLEEKRREMAVVISKLNEQNEHLRNLFQEMNTTRNNLEKIYTSSEELDIFAVTNYKNYYGKIIIDAKKQEYAIKQTKNLLKFKQLEVTESLKEVKVLEKLKETQKKKFYKHYEYLQAKEIDDIASTRYKKAS